MANHASVKVIVAYSLDLLWSSPARTTLPSLSDRQKVSLSLIICSLRIKAICVEQIWGEQGKLVALGCAITKLEAVVWK